MRATASTEAFDSKEQSTLPPMLWCDFYGPKVVPKGGGWSPKVVPKGGPHWWSPRGVPKGGPRETNSIVGGGPSIRSVVLLFDSQYLAP
jgi:hypothetical protein